MKGLINLRKHFLKQFLNFYWLRPENAIHLPLRAEKYYETIQYFGDGSQAIDVSCGNGVFSFISLGGEFGCESDMYHSIKTEKTFRTENYDTYDYYDDKYLINVRKRPDKFYHYGSDWKNNLLLKAGKLDAYKKLILHDNNYPFELQDESMQYVYSNSAYWVPNFYNHIKDLVRITKSEGYIVLEVKTKNIKEYTSRSYAPFMGEKFHEIINAGRLSTYKGLQTKDELMRMFEGIDEVEIVKFEPIYGDIMTYIWDIGLRPIFNPLAKMVNNLNVGKRADIKEEWIEIFYELFEEFVEQYLPTEKTATQFIVVLKKK